MINILYTFYLNSKKKYLNETILSAKYNKNKMLFELSLKKTSHLIC